MNETKKPIIIAIDGCDGCGKQTQAEILTKRLQNEGLNVVMKSFPNYNSEYCSLVKGYLSGAFAGNASEVPAKVSALFYALDRYASMKTEDWMSADIVIADRYISSNMVHQAAKLKNESEKLEFIKWINDIEINVLGIPAPKGVIFLNVPPKVSLKLRQERGELKNGKSKDIHESDAKFMEDSYNNAVFCANNMGWKTVNCCDENNLRTKESIADDIYSIAKKLLIK